MKAIALLLVLLTVATQPVIAGKRSNSNDARTSTSQSPETNIGGSFNLADFEATGNGIEDDGPALQRAFDALGDAGGGTLFVPAGRYAISTPVQKDFAGLAEHVVIFGVESLTPAPPPNSSGLLLTAGLDLVSEFAPRTGSQNVAIKLSGLQTLTIKDVTFIGTPDVETDALITLALTDMASAKIEHCEFYGLSSNEPGGSVLSSARSYLEIKQSVFLGSASNGGVNDPVVQNVQWKGFTVADTVFMDYGQRPELFGKLGEATPLSWVHLGEAASLDTDDLRREAIFINVFFDEGALNGLIALTAQVAAVTPVDLLYVSGLYMNVSSLNGSGSYINGPQKVLIENSHYGLSTAADSAISLLGVGNAILDRVECNDGANRISADGDTAKLTIINSAYGSLASAAPVTRVLMTAADEDAVQYVRQQFNALLGHGPDPPAHFFWSNRLLDCNDNAACIANHQTELGSYLASFPSPTFSISGKVTDEAGADSPGVNILLGGSQSAATTTDATGKFTFANLPTSGVYTLTPTLTSYAFNSPSHTITTPSGNQVVNFVGTLQSTIEFEAPSYSVNEGTQSITILVTRSGNISSDAEVTFAAIDGTADQKSDVIPIVGRLTFAAGELVKHFEVLITNDAHVEGDESLTLQLRDPANAVLGNDTASLKIIDNDTSATNTNPIDDAEFFVREHYTDFLNRPADAEGLAFWSNQILSCGNNAVCLADRRMNVSAAFFLSIEFQETGFLVYRLYKASYADVPDHLDEFLLDTRTIGQGLVVNAPGWQELLEANKTALISDFVGRARFVEEYPLTLTPAEFVEQLNAKAGETLTPEDLPGAVAEFGDATTSEDLAARARVVRLVAESELLTSRELNPAFVLMQYFGYLQRNPQDAPNTNLDGYNFWLNKLNEFNGDFRRAEMVKSFLVSGEYRERFGNP